MVLTKNQVVDFLKQQFKQGDVIVKLILINLSVYLLLKIIALVEWVFRLPHQAISKFISEWFYLSSDYTQVLKKFYTLFTYQFIHDDFLHIFINLILLYFFGKMLLKLIGLKKFVPLYILGGIFGGLMFVLFNALSIFPIEDKPIIGASASLMALMGSSAFLLPNYNLKFFLVFDVKLKWLVLGFALLNVLSIFSPEGAGAGIIHVGGLVFGYGFMYLGDKGIDLAAPFNKSMNYVLSLFNRKPKAKVSYVNPDKIIKKPKYEGKDQQKKVDAILDKISMNGYESLSTEEKDYLFKASKE